MSLYPGASVRLIDKKFLAGTGNGIRMAAYNRVNLHIAAGNGSLFNFFNQSGRASSHFWVAKSGLVEQYVDTDLRAEADLQGNDATISIETEGSDQWSEPQIQGIIALVSWITSHHGIPQQLAQDSQLGASSKGISWHRLGIDGNFPALPSRQAGRIQRGGGMHYSTARGKLCPVDPNIDLIFDRILPGVTGGASGGGGAPTPQPPTPQPTPPPQPSPGLKEDGLFGTMTIAEVQRQAGTPVDGEFWGQYIKNKQPAFVGGWVYNYPNVKGSPAWAWVQGRLGTPQDGVFGQKDLKAMEARAGFPYDAVLGYPSATVQWFQHALNTHTL